MISYQKIQKNAKDRLKDADVLYNGKRYRGAFYLCGCAVEQALKTIICKDLKLFGIPSTTDEFTKIAQIKTHNYDNLLGLIPIKIKEKLKTDKKLSFHWNIVLKWDNEIRYAEPPIGRSAKKEAKKLINSTKQLLIYFWKTLRNI